MSSPARISKLIFAAGLGAWIVQAAITWLSGAPLGHDEAHYAIAAQDMLAGNEPRWLYISPGTVMLATFGNLAGGSVYALRLPTFLFSIGFILAAAHLARRLCDHTTAAWVVAVLAGARPTVKWSAELLSDLPAATCLLAGTAILVGELVTDKAPRWRIVLAAPVFAAALYLRYASCIPIALVGVAALVVGWRAIVRRPAPIIATVALFVALLVPHLITSNATTGSPLGILLYSKTVPAHESFASGLYAYVTNNPFVFYGWLMPPVMIAGLLAVRSRNRGLVALALVAVVDIVILGVVSDAQARYVVFPTTVLAILGVEMIRRWIAGRDERSRTMLTRVAAATVVASWVVTAIGLVQNVEIRSEGTYATRTAAAVIRADAGTAVCHIVGYHYAQLEWYSGCRSGYGIPEDALARGERVYVVRDREGSWLEDELPKFTVILDQPRRVLRLEPR